ncbi:hypothetical protein FN846DRAFT_554086 [Sphaerosporella brunnea]|uniref:MARVEL domain-containing protein n=1 Tax=Sphaerosporella brunnea TaxID=1250544 RepID=A0A5J5F2R3_9PEZI|nr:hypothetical protein FN846DRAFT_554086 [Sphaerosporella brunnea]
MTVEAKSLAANGSYEIIYSNPPSPDLVTSTGPHSDDLTLKLWIRVLKLCARSLSLLCSSVVIALSIVTFQIFLTTRDLDPIDGFFPWARPTLLWPQILTLVIAALSFLASLWVMLGYLRHGHHGAEKASMVTMYTTGFALLGWIVIWATAAASMQHVRSIAGGKDLWGWACNKDTRRREVWEHMINYNLVCRSQDWNFVCAIIEVVTILFSAAVWVVTLWRLGVRRRKAMGEV